jgi:glucose-6-phosphate dehydrogenase assembly protein OpcA
LSAVSDQEWTGRDVTIGQIEHELAQLRSDSMDMRTSVMTHIAWAPPEWQDASRDTLAGMAERHPSRTLLLFPQDDERDALDAEVSLQCYTHAELQRHVCTEVIELRLCGRVAQAPASVILPLVLPDVPVFLRWRGEPPFGEPVFEQLIDVVDRLVVDSREWEGAPTCYAKLVEIFDRVAVSDIVWARTLRWRRAIAERGSGRQLRVRGPIQESSLLAGWLRSRLGHPVELEHTDADRIELAVLDGEEIHAREERPSASDLLSGELDRFSRDPIYESAVAAAL